jgi:hypothetical protein
MLEFIEGLDDLPVMGVIRQAWASKQTSPRERPPTRGLFGNSVAEPVMKYRPTNCRLKSVTTMQLTTSLVSLNRKEL